jgi:sugar O-acyltransferase (sialic acid O-acetyltransferase NeuD family)
MKDLVIFGAGDTAALACLYFERDLGRRVVAFTLDSEHRRENSFMGRPVLAFETLAAERPPASHDLFVALGYSRVNALRAAKARAARALGYTLPSYVSPRATTFPDLTHGDNCFILENNVIQPFVTIGNNVTLWSGNHIGHHSAIEDDVFIASHAVISGRVRVGEASFIGVNATLRDHITIGARCVIGAGALLLSDAAPDGVYMGQATERARVPSHRLRGI